MPREMICSAILGSQTLQNEAAQGDEDGRSDLTHLWRAGMGDCLSSAPQVYGRGGSIHV